MYQAFLFCLFLILTVGCSGNENPLQQLPIDNPRSQAASTLEGTSWIATQINGRALISGTTITLLFEKNSLGGTACNHYGGNYEIESSKLEVTDLVSTLAYCLEPPNAMDQEQTYLEILSRATRFQISDNRLEIGTTSDAFALVFESTQ